MNGKFKKINRKTDIHAMKKRPKDEEETPHSYESVDKHDYTTASGRCSSYSYTLPSSKPKREII